MFRMQSSFTKGEIDQKMLARVDYDGYFKAAQRLRNVFVIPQGGATRRFGLKYIASITAPASDDQLKMTIFEHSDGEYYVMVFRALQILIYHDDALVQTLVSPFAAAEIPKIQYIQSTDALLITQENHTPRSLTRTTAAHDSWSIDAAVFKKEPTFDFDRGYGDLTFDLRSSGGGYFIETDNRAGTGTRLEITSGSFFTSDMEGGLGIFYGGICTLDTYISATRMDGIVKQPFDILATGRLAMETINFPGYDVVCTEPCFSTVRGWPTRIGSFQNRIIFGNTTSIHDAIFNSSFDGFYNNELDFDDGSDDAEAAFTIQVGDGSASEVRAIYGSTSLFVFTKTAVYTTSVYNDKGYSYDNAALVAQAKMGIMPWVEPVEIDGKVIFVEDGGRIVNGLTYSNDKQGFSALNLSLLASHLIRNPRRLASYKNPADVDGKFLFCVNGEDGTLATLQVIDEQQILAWSLSETTGEFLEVATSSGKGYFIVKREVNGNDVYYLEKIDFDLVTDSAVTGTNSPANATITGLSHLEGEEVKIISDYRVVDTKTVSGGEVTLDETIEDYQVGLNYTTEIQPMPVVIGLENQGEMDVYGTKHINTVYVDYYESLGLKLNDVTIPFRSFGASGSLSDPEPQSGFTAMTLMEGWDPRQSITLTQDEPYPMTIRGIAYSIDADIKEQ